MNIEQLEEILKALILNEVCSLRDLLCAYHNICAHGQILDNLGYEFTGEQLEKLFEGFDISIQTLKDIEYQS